MHKQVVIARRDLNMSPGKLSAQVSHAAMAFLTNMIQKKAYPAEATGIPTYKQDADCYYCELKFDAGLYENWINGSFTKCVLQAKNKNQLLKAKKIAEEMGMQEGKDFFLIYDACRTELEPEEIDKDGIGRTLTCIGFAPMDEDVINKIGRKYQLY